MGELPPKKGKSKLPLFCGNVEQVITIYDGKEDTKKVTESQWSLRPHFRIIFSWLQRM